MTIPDGCIWRLVPGSRQNQVAPKWFTWILNDHYQLQSGTRTELGQLVYEAKYKFDRPAMAKLTNAARHSVLQFSRDRDPVKNLCSIDAVVAVPYFGHKPLSIPREVAREIAQELGKTDLSDDVKKIVSTGPSKSGTPASPDHFIAEPNLRGKSVLIVDDVFMTGLTLSAVGTCLQSAGVVSLVGLCMTKAAKGMI